MAAYCEKVVNSTAVNSKRNTLVGKSKKRQERRDPGSVEEI